MSKNVSVTCPHCGAALAIDVDAGVVTGHEPAAGPAKERADFDARLRQLEAEKARSADRLAEAMRKESSKERLMEDKFRELMDKARKDEDQSRPVRDIDLD